MKIVVLDISGRNAQSYSHSLCTALSEENKGNVLLLAPHNNCRGVYRRYPLVNLVPSKFKQSQGIIKRMLMGVETSINYIYVFLFFALTSQDVLHIQWLPFMEFTGGEHLFLKILRIFNPRLKILLTIHNIYPHCISNNQRENYKKRFKKIDKWISGYIIHLQNSKKKIVDEFGIPSEKIYVAYMGIIPGGITQTINKSDGKKHIIMFGLMNRYKGADLLVKSLKRLDKEKLKKISVKIIGKTEEDIYNENINDANLLGIEWINRYVSNQELTDSISNSDMIILPYRNITQSAVLLSALSYKKVVLTSDLPSFKETLEGYPDDYFFKTENVESLSSLLSRYIENEIDEKKVLEIVERLNKKYTWNESARQMLLAYMNC